MYIRVGYHFIKNCLVSWLVPNVSLELADGCLETGGLLCPPPLVSMALLQLALHPQQLGLVALLHNVAWEGRHA